MHYSASSSGGALVRSSRQRSSGTWAGVVDVRKSSSTRKNHSASRRGQEVAGAVEDLEPGARNGLGCPVSVRDGDDPVVVPPDDEGRDGLGQVEAVVGADSLTSEVDHRADGVDEGHLAVSVGQAGVAAPHLGQGVARVASRRGGPRYRATRQLHGSEGAAGAGARTRRRAGSRL